MKARFRSVSLSWIGGLLFLGFVAMGCKKSEGSSDSAPPDSREPRLVLLYSTCTVNKSFLGPYNPDIEFTPQLDAFAHDSSVLGNHRSEAGLSGVSFASIYTGKSALGHGIFTHPVAMSEGNYDITEAFKDNGYDVHFFNAHPMAAYGLNYGQGTPPNQVYKMLWGNNPDYKNILTRLRQDENYKAFIVTNFSVTHAPYNTKHLEDFCGRYPGRCEALDAIDEKDRKRLLEFYQSHYTSLSYGLSPKLRLQNELSDEDFVNLETLLQTLYSANVMFLDDLFGFIVKLIDEAGLEDESLIVFTADHGEIIRDGKAEFRWGHSHSLHKEVLDVPLIIRGSGLGIEPRRKNFVTRSTDVFPTMAGLTNLELPEDLGMTGQDLSGFLKGSHPDPNLRAYSHTGVLPTFIERLPPEEEGLRRTALYPKVDINLSWVAVRFGDETWKYKNRGDGVFVFEGYDLSQDPDETANIYDPDIKEHRDIARELESYKAQLVAAYDSWKEAGSQKQISDEESLERLRDIGYLK